MSAKQYRRILFIQLVWEMERTLYNYVFLVR